MDLEKLAEHIVREVAEALDVDIGVISETRAKARALHIVRELYETAEAMYLDCALERARGLVQGEEVSAKRAREQGGAVERAERDVAWARAHLAKAEANAKARFAASFDPGNPEPHADGAP